MNCYAPLNGSEGVSMVQAVPLKISLAVAVRYDVRGRYKAAFTK